MLKILPPTLSGASEHEKPEVYRGIKSLIAYLPDGTVTLIPGDYLELKFAFPGKTERIKLLDETFEETVRELGKLLHTLVHWGQSSG
jgi:hypothetical protein